MRHTFATRLCESGINVKVIQDILGHSDITTTLDLYTSVSNSFQQEEFQKASGKIKSVME